MEVDMATVGSIVGAAIAALGGREAWARRSRSSGSDRPAPAHRESLADLHRQVTDIHTLAYAPDADGVPLHARITGAIRDTAKSARNQEDLLRRIAEGQERLASAVISASRPPGR